MTERPECEAEGHDATMNLYMTQYYDDTEVVDTIEQCNSSKDIFFYTPIAIPDTSLMLHVWSVKVIGPLAPRVFYFTVYENGTIIDPAIDERFRRAYTFFFTDGVRRRPWVECYFTRLQSITHFLRFCAFRSSLVSPPPDEATRPEIEKPFIMTKLRISVTDTLNDLLSR